MVIAYLKLKVVTPTVFLVSVWLASLSVAQQFDPLLGYLFSANEESWSIGGDLANIQPYQLRLPVSNDQVSGRGISLSGIYSDYYRNGALETPKASFRRGFQAEAFWTRRDPFLWEVRSRSVNRLWNVSSLNDRNEQLLTTRYERWMTSLEGKAVVAPAILSAGLNVGPRIPPEPYIAGSVDFRRYGALGALWQQQRISPDIDVFWHDERAHVELLGLQERMLAWLESSEVGPFHAEILLHRSNWIRNERGNTEATLEPWGRQVGFHGFLSLDMGSWNGRWGLRGQEFNLMAYGMKDPYPYAKITSFNLDIDAVFASVEIRKAGRESRLIAEVERLRWKGYARGHVEFWPFTSGFIDFLGLRRYFVATTSGHLWRLHAGGTAGLANRWRGVGGFNLMDIWPAAEIRHWRPVYLVFGKEDEQLHSLDVYRLAAGVIHLSITYGPTAWAVSYSITQAVPIKSWRSSPGSGTPSDPPEKVRGYGGGFHRLGFEWYF